MKCATALLTVTAIVAVWGAAFAAEPTQTDFDACNREAQSIGSPSASPGGTTSSGVGAGGSASGGMRAGASGSAAGGATSGSVDTSGSVSTSASGTGGTSTSTIT